MATGSEAALFREPWVGFHLSIQARRALSGPRTLRDIASSALPTRENSGETLPPASTIPVGASDCGVIRNGREGCRTGKQSGKPVLHQWGYTRYGAAKPLLSHYSRYLAQDLGPFGITANCIAPGVIATGRIMQRSFRAAARVIGIDPTWSLFGGSVLSRIAARWSSSCDRPVRLCDRSGNPD